MATPYLGEIRTVGFTFAPPGWLQCNGQSLSISEYEALFTLIGTTYGGDGQNTFNLPNLQSRVNVGAGNGAGLNAYTPGQTGGTEMVTLNTNQLPSHIHPFAASVGATTSGTATANPVGQYPGNAPSPVYASTATQSLAGGSITGNAQSSGSSQSHPNIQPVLALMCIICVEGIFPPRAN